MTDAYLGEIRGFGFPWAPRNWLLCDGSVLPINQNTGLFSLIGVTYGGNGTTTFALPDLRGRAAVGQGQGPGLSPYQIGQQGGTETVTLRTGQLPSHNHGATGSSASTAKSPGGAVPGFTAAASSYATTLDTPMDGQFIGQTGGNEAHDNLAPYLAISWCICVAGIYPSRP